jgi:hypothetical protein
MRESSYQLKNNYLSPKIKEMTLDGKQPKHLKLQDLNKILTIFYARVYVYIFREACSHFTTGST